MKQYDKQLVRDAIEEADMNALRVTLYQHTRDSRFKDMGVELKTIPGTPYDILAVPEEHHDTLKEAAFEYLTNPEAPVRTHLSQEEVRELIDVFDSTPATDSVARFAYEELAFDGYKRSAAWQNGRPAAADDFEVLIIGAGFSAIVCAIQLQGLGIRYRIIERHGDFGGTWIWNAYPDARVDITNFIYSFTFEPDYPWQHAFAPREELLKYIDHLVEKYGLRTHTTFNTKVTRAEWQEETARWQVDLEGADGTPETIQPNIVLSCAGLFSTAKLPDIEGIETFNGAMFHTTQWDQDYDYTGKRVAIIGTGSTGSQLLPRVAEKAEFVSVYQRTPNWVTPVGRYRAPIPEPRKWLLANLPGYANWNRYTFVQASVRNQELQYLDEEWRAKGGKINEKNDNLREMLIGRIKHKMAAKPEYIEHLIPDFAPLSRRIVVDNGFYDTLLRDNVELVSDPIDCITPAGIRSNDGIQRNFDLIVLAAGFEVERYLWPVTYVGREGRTIEELWSEDGARAYVTMTLPGFPNFFMMYGPNAGVRAGSFHSAVEMLSRYICSAITQMIENGATSTELKREVYLDYNKRLDEGMTALLWEEEKGGKSYYLNQHGKSGVNMPWRMHEFYDLIYEADPSHYQHR